MFITYVGYKITRIMEEITMNKIYTMQQVATMFNVTRQTLMAYVKKHNIKHGRKFGKQVFFTQEQLISLCGAMNYPFAMLFSEEEHEGK